MSRHLIISGAPSTGKSSLIKKLREQYPVLEDYCMFITDGGRWWMEEREKKTGAPMKIDELSLEERSTMQWEIFEYYESHVKEAAIKNKIIVADAFYAEVMAYGLGFLSKEQIEIIEGRLLEYENNIQVIVLPMIQIPLEIDGLRHESEDFREEVEEIIIRTYKKYQIPYHEVSTSILEERVEIVAALLKVSELANYSQPVLFK